jgi:hypothetical protein
MGCHVREVVLLSMKLIVVYMTPIRAWSVLPRTYYVMAAMVPVL